MAELAPPPDPTLAPDEQPTVVMEPVPEEPAQAQPPQPTDDDQNAPEGRFNIQVVDASQGVVANANDYAYRHLAEQSTQRGFRGFLKRIWHGNIARDYIRLSKSQEGRERILETGNIYALSDRSQAGHDTAMATVVERFTNDYLHGEHKVALSDTETGQQLESQLRVLVNHFAQGGIDAAELTEHKTRLLDDYKERLHAEDRNKGLMLADNVLEVAQAARAAVRNGEGLERVMDAVKGYAGEARMGQRTEASRELVDRVVDKLYSTKAGSLVNETTLGAATAVVLAVTKLTTRKALTAVLAVAGMGAGAGAIAGVREYVHIGHERTQHLRERAVGEEVAPGAKRRQELEETRYNTASATDLHDQLEQAREAVAAAEPAGIRDGLRAITEIEARIKLSDDRSIDLISYSSETRVEPERMKLDMALAEAKAAARQVLQGASDEAINDIGVSRDLDAVVTNGVEGTFEQLNRDISAKDAVFAKVRWNHALKMTGVGLATGVTFGLASQEVRALFSDSLQGIFDGNSSHVDRRTLLAGIFDHGSDPQHAHAAVAGMHDPQLSHNGSLVVPEGYHLHQASAGHWELINSENHTVAQNLSVNGQGALTPESQHELTQAGFRLHEAHQPYTTPHVVPETVHRTPAEFLHHHPGDFTQVHRELWYDNNTPHVFDQNELRMDWGGHGGTGLDHHGNFIFNVNHMTPGGSFHDSLSANAQQLIHEGKLAVALSMTDGTQSHVVLVPVDMNGNAVIKAHSWMAHSLFENHNGQAHFIGAYAEAVQLLGKHHGVESVRMLATVVGENHVQHVTDHVSHLVAQHHEGTATTLSLAEVAQPHHTGVPVEIPPVLPIYGRRGLEVLTPEEQERLDYFGYRGEPTAEQRQRWRENLSPRLCDDPDVNLDPGEELSWYRRHLEEQRGPEYLEEIDGYIDNDEILAQIDESIDAVVSIPVAAANEADNIYDTLSLYAQQSDDAKRRTVVLLNVNWTQAAGADPARRSEIDRTISEIERAKRDFPDLKLASFQKEWSNELMEERKSVIYGEVVKVLYDTAMLATERAVREGRRSDKEALLITNDADAVGLRKNYLDIYLDAINKYPDSDAYTGLIRFDTRKHGDYPGHAIATNLMMLFSMASGRKGRGYNASPSTPGANTGFRMSSLAAIGGCDDAPDMGAGADTILGRKLRAARSERGLSAPGVGVSGASSTASTAGDSADDTDSSDRQTIRHLYAAQIDTNGDRFLGVYRQGRLVESAWRDYDEEGYRDRREELNGLGDDEVEDPLRDIDSIAARIEREVSFLGTDWHPQPGLISWTLGAYFGTTDNEGQPLYALDWDKGQFTFKFTESGKGWLSNRLTRDQRGRFDPYGNRVQRRLYRAVPPGSARPAPPGERFVQPIAGGV